ncbi:acyl carrier protein phosphodiesterase [Pseudomonas duriflava]|uniref:Acyl carrier protein phosphodiesterase n=1 Tax=Pseudomonas duriflava TaxID=459528 RepID=A0A562QDW5_9PSED|nr:ACP phosphodiesterase [Pseudomonas duriflava]TWI54889.1 acyl carrier protein phosphodiesterase [Pseudomonas duriflava]
MNYLAHLHLGGSGRDQLLGSLYGDFVKGPLDNQWSPGIEAAIRLHRRIDAFTDRHWLVDQARARFPAPRRRVSGILLDVFFDHCLARHWADYAEQPLGDFTAEVYRVLLTEPELPPRLARIAPHMATQDWLGSYQTFDVLERVIDGMASRFSRPALMTGAFTELAERYDVLEADFRAFYPEVQAFVQHELSTTS